MYDKTWKFVWKVFRDISLHLLYILLFGKNIYHKFFGQRLSLAVKLLQKTTSTELSPFDNIFEKFQKYPKFLPEKL